MIAGRGPNQGAVSNLAVKLFIYNEIREGATDVGGSPSKIPVVLTQGVVDFNHRIYELGTAPVTFSKY